MYKTEMCSWIHPCKKKNCLYWHLSIPVCHSQKPFSGCEHRYGYSVFQQWCVVYLFWHRFYKHGQLAYCWMQYITNTNGGDNVKNEYFIYPTILLYICSFHGNTQEALLLEHPLKLVKHSYMHTLRYVFELIYSCISDKHKYLN